MTVWSTIENKARAALANAATAPNHVAWLDAMANVPYGALGAAIEEIDRLRADVAAKHDVIAAMTESSQRIIDHAVQARARMAPLATFPVVTRIKPSVCDTNPMEAEHPTSDEPRPRVRLSVDRRVIDDCIDLQREFNRRNSEHADVVMCGQRGGKLYDLVARTPKDGVFLCTTEHGKKQAEAMCALQGRADIRVVMNNAISSWGLLDAARAESRGDGVD